MTQEELIKEIVEEIVDEVSKSGPKGNFARNIKGEFFALEDSKFCSTCWGEKKITQNAGYDNEYTTPCPDCTGEEEDYSGASEGDR